jgi:hypothetical protein
MEDDAVSGNTPHPSEQVDRVAEAICQAMHPTSSPYEIKERLAHNSHDYWGMARAALDAATPELIAEIERLRAGGAWVEHVERQRAMKRERDGECICNTGPDTEGPDEFCPWHGRRYSELVEIIVQQQAQINAAALDAATSPPDRWGEGYRAGVIEGMYRAAHNAQDHARCTELGIPYEQGMPAVGSVGEHDL